MLDQDSDGQDRLPGSDLLRSEGSGFRLDRGGCPPEELLYTGSDSTCFHELTNDTGGPEAPEYLPRPPVRPEPSDANDGPSER